jgi:hypothetical protein
VRSIVELGAALATMAAGLLYAVVIASEHEPLEPVTWVIWATVAAAGATALAGGFARSRRTRAALFGFTALVDLAWALLGALSIGLAFVPGLVLAATAARRRR